MTLIISAHTADHAIQVADRRITLPDGTVVDDDRNKGTIFDGRYSVAYTGPAHMPDKQGRAMRMDHWLSLVLAEAPSANPFGHLMQSAANSIHVAMANNKSTEFVAVGWTYAQEHSCYVPSLVIVSNRYVEMTDGSRRWFELAGKPNPHFTIQNYTGTNATYAPEEWRFWSTGVSLPPQVARDLRRRLNEAKRKGVGPVTVARILRDGIRAVRSGVVSNDVLVCIVPRVRESTHDLAVTPAVGGEPTVTEIASFLMQSSPSSELIWQLPNYVRNGWVATGIENTRGDQRHGFSWQLRRRGWGILAMGMQDAQTGARNWLSISTSGRHEIRISRPGQADEVHTYDIDLPNAPVTEQKSYPNERP